MPDDWESLSIKKEVKMNCYCCGGTIGGTCDCNRDVDKSCFSCGKCKEHCRCGHYKPYINSGIFWKHRNKILNKQ